LGASWQRNAVAGDHFDLGAKVFFYAAGSADSLAPRLRSLKVAGATNAPVVRTVRLARLQYDGNWDPEPGAFRRLAKILRAKASVDLIVDPVVIADLDVNKNPVAHLTASEPLKLPLSAIDKLKAFVAGGGTLLFDPCGGGDKTIEALQSIAGQLGPQGSLEVVPPDAPFLTGEVSLGEKLEGLRLRRWVVAHPVSSTKFRAIKSGERYAVIVAPLDIISGMLGTQTQGIAGYTPDTSVTLMRNLLVSSDAKAATQPALRSIDAPDSRRAPP
jgi:hypothetical protein